MLPLDLSLQNVSGDAPMYQPHVLLAGNQSMFGTARGCDDVEFPLGERMIFRLLRRHRMDSQQ